MFVRSSVGARKLDCVASSNGARRPPRRRRARAPNLLEQVRIERMQRIDRTEEEANRISVTFANLLCCIPDRCWMTSAPRPWLRAASTSCSFTSTRDAFICGGIGASSSFCDEGRRALKHSHPNGGGRRCPTLWCESIAGRPLRSGV